MEKKFKREGEKNGERREISFEKEEKNGEKAKKFGEMR